MRLGVNRSQAVATAFVAMVVQLAGAPAASAGSETLSITNAWVHAADQVGGNLALSMKIKNEADTADALMRVRCPVANFSERHTVDRGEGAPAMRSIPSIPLAANSTVVLKPDGFHVMLLQTREPLPAGHRFTCAIVFQKAGTIETEVNVRALP